jgi:hypothetical protein
MEEVEMGSVRRTSFYVSVAILACALTVMVGYTTCSTVTRPSADSEEPDARRGNAVKTMAPDRALTIAIKALADAKIELFDRYKIEMNPGENGQGWRVWFFLLPEGPGLDVLVIVANDGKTSVLLGR